MASQFDAVARISVDLRGFREASNQVTKSGGDMERVFKSLHGVLGKVELVEKRTAAELSRTLRVYNQASQAARNYATAIAAMAKSSVSSAQGVRAMETAFGALRRALGSVQGMSEKEHSRLQRTLSLYQQMANALNTLARAQQSMTGVSQAAQKVENAATRERNRAAEAARQLALAEQRVQIARQRSATAARDAASRELRTQQQLLRAQADLTAARARDAAAAARQASASRTAASGAASQTQASFGLRSALTDLEQLYKNSLQLLGQMGAAAVSAAISHEAAFSQIERVTGLTGNELGVMKQRFEELAAVLPVSFEELARVGQLASQTGVANEQLLAFTDTVVRFSVTTGVSSEQVTLLMARIMQMQDIPTNELNNLASAILALGISSASTEEEILRVAESISTVSDLFGLSTQATIGLASALATLRVRPELARGSLTRVFAQLHTAVNDSGGAMATLSSVMGETEGSMKALLENDPDAFFLKFIKGMSSTIGEAGSLREVLRDLGINAVRDIDTISRLANNYDLLAEQVQRARVEFLLGNKLQQQSATIFDTVRVRIDNMRDAFQTLIAKVGAPFARVLGFIAGYAQDLFEILSRFPVATAIFGGLATVITLGVAGWLAYRVAVAGTYRSVIALQEAQVRLGASSFSLAGALRMLAGFQAQQAASATASAAATTAAASAQTAAARSAIAANTANNLMATSTAGLVAGMQRAQASAARLNGTYRSTATAAAASNAATANQAVLNRNAGVSMRGLANVTATYGSALVGTYQAQRNMVGGLTASQIVANRWNEATRAATAATTAGAAATTASAGAMGIAGRAAAGLATALTFLRTHWLAVLSVVGLLFLAVGPLISAFSNAGNKMRQASQDAVAAVGGLGAYQQALVQDTQAAEKAAGGIQGVERALRSSGVAATEAGRFYGTVKVAADDLTNSLARKTREDLAAIQAQRRAIETSKGSIAQLQRQAKGQGALADAARESLADIEALTAQEKNYKEALAGTTLAIGENARALAEKQFQEALTKSGLVDTAKSYNQLRDAIEATNFNFDDIFGADTPQSLRTIRTELASLQGEYKRLQVVISSSESQTGVSPDQKRAASEQIKQVENQIKVYEFLESVVKDNREAFDSATRSASILTELGLDPLGDAAGEGSEAAEAQADAIEALEERINSLGETYKALIDPVAAWKGETDEAIQSVNAFTERLKAQVTAQQSFAKNLAVLSSQGYTALVEQLRAMGPEGASAAAQLVNATDAELKRLEVVATQAGEGYRTALATTMDKVSGLGLGERAARSISDGIVRHLNAVAAQGGSIDMATERITSLLDLIGAKQIKPEVVVDILGAMGNLEKLQTAIATAKQNKSLDAEGRAFLDTVLYNEALTTLTGQIDALEAEHKVDANGNARLDKSGYEAALRELQNSAAVTILEGLIDTKGDSDLNTKPYEDALGRLRGLVGDTEDNGRLDPNGTAKLSDDFFLRQLETLKNGLLNKNKIGWFDPRGSARLSTGTFYAQLPRLQQAAWTTGRSIQNALTRSATVSVGYYYYQKNSPPRTARVKDGGKMSGPGGPRDDRIPALLSDGEYVVNARSTGEYENLLHAINNRRGVQSALQEAMTRNRYADGGPVFRTSGSLVGQQAPRMVDQIQRATERGGSGPVFNITNIYPQAEPTSVSINRSLAYAAVISGV